MFSVVILHNEEGKIRELITHDNLPYQNRSTQKSKLIIDVVSQSNHQIHRKDTKLPNHIRYRFRFRSRFRVVLKYRQIPCFTDLQALKRRQTKNPECMYQRLHEEGQPTTSLRRLSLRWIFTEFWICDGILGWVWIV